MLYMKLGEAQREDLMESLAATPRFLHESFDGLSLEASRLRGPKGTFSPVEQIWHLADLEQEGSLNLTPDELKTFKRNKGAWAYFETAAPSYRRTMIYWIVSPKQEATRARRLAKLIGSCAAGVRLLP